MNSNVISAVLIMLVSSLLCIVMTVEGLNDGIVYTLAKEHADKTSGSLDDHNSLEEYEEYPRVIESRYELGTSSFPFARAGRSDGLENRLAKLGVRVHGMQRGVRAGNAMWFGPRLGRVQ